MEKKKLDVMQSKYLNTLIKSLNSLGVSREDLVAIYPPMGNTEGFTAIFYC